MGNISIGFVKINAYDNRLDVYYGQIFDICHANIYVNWYRIEYALSYDNYLLFKCGCMNFQFKNGDEIDIAGMSTCFHRFFISFR